MPALPVAEIPDGCQRQIVACDTDAAENTIVTNPADKHLHLVLGNGRALRCGIAVGRAGFLWSGEAVIAGRRPWPSRTPPPEMIAHRPDLAQFRTGRPGGPTKPLGARAPILRRKMAVRARCRSR
jgi:lipoprotein-anchoring transpeptidase ErfK/SrfK